MIGWDPYGWRLLLRKKKAPPGKKFQAPDKTGIATDPVARHVYQCTLVQAFIYIVSFMKQLFLKSALLGYLIAICGPLMSGLVYGQTKRPAKKAPRSATTQTTKPAPVVMQYNDVIYKTDQSTINAKVDEMTDTDVRYFVAAMPTTKQALARNEVWKIVFSDGSVEVITAPATNVVPTATDNATSPTTATPLRSESAGYKAPVATGRYRAPANYGRLNVTVGPEASLYTLMNQTRWTNEYAGLGMNQNIGGSLRIDYRLVKALAVSLTGGYSRWDLVRNYQLGGVEKYDETVQLTRIQALAGIKIYAGSLYLLPEGGVNLTTTKTTTSGAHPKPTNEQASSTPITYGASLGYEFNMGSFLIDLSGRYQILDVKNLSFGAISPALTEKIQFASLRVGIGFSAFRK